MADRRLTTALLALAFAAALCGLPAPSVARASGYAASTPTPGATYRDGQTGRYLLGGAWLYRADPTDQGITSGWWRSPAVTSDWTPSTVPNAFNAGDFSDASMAGSVGWYRRDFTLPPAAFARSVPATQRHWIVRFDSVNYRATVWLNGVLIGRHTGAYLPFELDLKSLHRVNRLVVRVDSRHSQADLPPGPGGGWWNFGGLLGGVYLRAIHEADISQVSVRTLDPCPRCAARIAVQARLRNLGTSPLTVTLAGSYGPARLDFGSVTLAAGGSWTAGAVAVLRHPRLWSPDQPTLYRAALTLTDDRGARLGGYITYSGVRTIAVNPGGRLTLNGRALHLRGVNLHEQALGVGAALGPAHLKRLMGWATRLGAQIIRAHYPLDPELEEMADRDGVLIWSEIPVYGTSSAYLRQAAWLAQAHRVLRENIMANQNHPSVAVWSIGNELQTPAPAAEKDYIAGAAALAHRLDPSRPVGMAVSDWPGVPCQAAYEPLDVIGVNEYFGWYDAGGGTTDDRDRLSPFLDSVRACYPSKATLITEFGFEASRAGPVDERGTYAFQSDSAAFHLGVFATKPWLSGALYFALQDFAVTPHWTGGNPYPDPPLHQKGLIDLSGAAKPAFSVVAAIFHATRQIAPSGH